jgi:NAD(P)-dependent dehydrogenase (short-subunit alcohol dehydrogenase family)
VNSTPALLDGKTCIVTGAGKGFGRTIAEVFRSNGARLALITRSHEDVKSIESRFSMEKNNVLVMCGDVSKRGVVEEFVELTIHKFGSVDVLVNNAGIRFRKAFLEIRTEELEHVMAVNFQSMFHLCQEVLPHMVSKKQGKIINISSVAGSLGLPDLSGYVASKAAVIGLTKALAVEFGGSNIQINALAPGFCKTSFYENFIEKRDLYKFTIDRTPMSRWGESEELANVCLFLASRLSDYVTGDVISVDGGWSAW